MKALSSTWLTTFGDVLTLLLCFVLVTMTNINNQTKHENESIQVDTSITHSDKESSDTFGKPIASKIVSEYRQLYLVLDKSDFDLEQKALNSQGLAKLSELNLKDLKRFELGICNLDQNYAESLYQYFIDQRQLKASSVFSGNMACAVSKNLNKTAEQKSLLIRAWF